MCEDSGCDLDQRWRTEAPRWALGGHRRPRPSSGCSQGTTHGGTAGRRVTDPSWFSWDFPGFDTGSRRQSAIAGHPCPFLCLSCSLLKTWFCLCNVAAGMLRLLLTKQQTLDTFHAFLPGSPPSLPPPNPLWSPRSRGTEHTLRQCPASCP